MRFSCLDCLAKEDFWPGCRTRANAGHSLGRGRETKPGRFLGEPGALRYTGAVSEGGLQIQAYVDPGTPGTNQLHVTAFDASGNELPLGSTSVHAESPSGMNMLDMQRFSAGHFVANLDIVPGPWRFMIAATAKDGSILTASFQQTFEG